MSKGLQIPFQFATSEAPTRWSGISGSSGGLSAQRSMRNSTGEVSREPSHVFRPSALPLSKRSLCQLFLFFFSSNEEKRLENPSIPRRA